MKLQMLIAGFGGQGVLFAGKVVAYTGLLSDKQLSWLPSYGPEMRGGTANCSVCIDEKPIGCPIVTQPDLFLAMNAPSFEKFSKAVNSNGTVIYDSSLIQHPTIRKDVSYYGIPTTLLATKHEIDGLANLILLGHTLQHIPFSTYELVCRGVEKCIPPHKAQLLERNFKALQLGYEYKEGSLS